MSARLLDGVVDVVKSAADDGRAGVRRVVVELQRDLPVAVEYHGKRWLADHHDRNVRPGGDRNAPQLNGFDALLDDSRRHDGLRPWIEGTDPRE